jgi:hypothetical protein
MDPNDIRVAVAEHNDVTHDKMQVFTEAASEPLL